MRWVRHYRRQQSATRALMKKIERRGMMAKVKQPTNKAQKPKVQALAPELEFVMCDGTRLKSIEELARLMDNMEESHFGFHVNSEKNDFANWIKDVFHEKTLADEMLQAKDRKHCHIALLRHVAFGKR